MGPQPHTYGRGR
eukprot:gene20829-biopygen19141